MRPNFDPKLKAAMAEIRAVLTKYDCGGMINLASKTHGEWLLIQPSWSMYREVQDGKAGHMKLHLKSNHEDTEATVHFLLSTMDVCGLMYLRLADLKKQLDKHCEIDHTFRPTDG